MNRRNVLLGLGATAAGSGIVFGSGAFTQVQAEREVSIGVDSDSEALLALEANADIASVKNDTDTGELFIDTDQLSEGNEGFNSGARVQIGETNESFGDTVSRENGAFTITNNFDEVPRDSEDNNELDIGIDLSDLTDPKSELEFVVTVYDDSDSQDRDFRISPSDGQEVITGVASGEELHVAIFIDTASVSSPKDFEGEVVIAAGPSLNDGSEFPEDTELVEENQVLNVNSGVTFDATELDTPIQDAVDDADSFDTIRVGPDTDVDYSENITINVEGLTLEGAGADSSTIAGQDSVAVTSTAPNVEIAGFRIENPEGSRAVRVTDDATNAVIRDNTVTNVNTENDANQPRGIVVGGLDDGDSADGLEIKNNTVTNIEGADPDEDQAHAIQILEESNGGGLIENVTVDGNTIDGILDTRSTVAVNFNGNIEGEITNNNISGLNTEGTTDSGDPGGFTQVIALNAGGNASSGPQNVNISDNEISNIETTTDENYAPPYHIIIGGDADGDTISIDSNEFKADSPDTDVYLNDGTGSVDLENVISTNNFDTEPVLIDLNDDEEDETIVPPNFE